MAIAEHIGVALACIPGLLHASADANELTKRNGLGTLALLPGGPRPQAPGMFQQGCNSPDGGVAQVSALGLLRENGGESNGNAGNVLSVEKALGAASDIDRRMALLSAVGQSHFKSEALPESARELLANSDPEVQSRAVRAFVSSAPDEGHSRPAGVASPRSPHTDDTQLTAALACAANSAGVR